MSVINNVCISAKKKIGKKFEKTKIMIPEAIDDYITYMDRVDHFD
jgi:hypothetical protein